VNASRQSATAVDLRDDAQLMAETVSGSGEAFAELYSRYHGRAYKVAQSVCRDRERSEDAVQEAFAAIWRGRAKYEPTRGTVARWLLMLVRYRAIDVARENQKHALRRASEESVDIRPAPGDIVETIIARDDAADLRSQLARLPDLQREVVVLAYYGELTHSEIAITLGLPAGTVKGRMRLGIHKLRADAGAGQHCAPDDTAP
jgi:RNA polymerase sigma-70 factor (ECF subfamily)